MHYGYTIIYVQDVEATLLFYQRAFGFSRKFVTPEGDYGELVSGETTIAFASLELGTSNLSEGMEPIKKMGKPVGIEMAFVTETIQDDFQKAVDAGAAVYEPISRKPWGQQVAYVRDCNGLLIEICTPVLPS